MTDLHYTISTSLSQKRCTGGLLTQKALERYEDVISELYTATNSLRLTTNLDLGELCRVTNPDHFLNLVVIDHYLPLARSSHSQTTLVITYSLYATMLTTSL